MRRNALVWLAVVAIALLIAHACGYAFGVANQTTYFLEALQRVHPELFHNDWLVTSTASYHTVFGVVAGLLLRLDDAGAAIGVTHVVLMVALLCGLYLIVRTASPRSSLPIFMVVAGWLAVNGGHSIAGSYVWSSYLQPSLIGSVGWIIALAMHVRGKPLATGIALALGGVFHVNFLLLGIGMFGLAELLAERPSRARRLAQVLVPQLLVLAVLAPELVANAGGGDPDRALWVLVRFHAPLHYHPSWIERGLPGFIRWIALAIVVAPVALAYGERGAQRRLLAWSIIAAALCVLGTLITKIPAALPLTRLFVWRLAPFAVLAAQVVIASTIAATIHDPQCWRAQPLWRRLAAVGLAVWIAARTPFVLPAEADWVPWAIIVAITIAWFVPVSGRTWLLALSTATVLAAPLAYRRDQILDPPVGVASEGGERDALYAWVRASTPVDAVFLTPPDLFRFRLIARRAIYADFKSPPLAPGDLIEWHERLRRMTGASATEKVPDHRKRWLEATGDELLGRARQLGADYLVLDRTPSHEQITATPAFRNDSFAVYPVR